MFRGDPNVPSRHGRHFSMFALLWIIVAGVPPAVADADKGERLFKKCKACHEIGEGARNRVGPHLDGIINRAAGSIKAFKYSAAMRKAGNDGLVWTAENLARYLAKPRTFLPGNRMSFRGMPDLDDRRQLIEYLKVTSTAEPAADPTKKIELGGPARSFTDLVLAMEGDPAYGEYLAGECVTCHQASGHADGIPSIVGVPKDYFIAALFEYKYNIRTNEVMKLRVQNLNNEEIAALAAYYSGLTPQ